MELIDDFEQLDYIENDALVIAQAFINGWSDWNEDEVLKKACDWYGYDYDFVWLTLRVLMGPAVVYTVTGKSV